MNIFVVYFNLSVFRKKCKEKKKKIAAKSQRHEVTKILWLSDFVAEKLNFTDCYNCINGISLSF